MSDVPPSADRNQLVSAVLDAAPGPLIGVDARGVVDYANARAIEAFGYAPEELLGQSVEVLVPDDVVEHHVGLRGEYVAHPRPFEMGESGTQRVRRKDGSVFPAEISLTPVTTSAGLWVIASVRDLTAWQAQRAELYEVSRAYRSIAELNEAIVRAPDALSLYAQTCRIAVDRAGYLAAWVGRRGPDGSVECVARAGPLDDYIDALRVSTDPDDPHGRGPAGTTLREGVATFSTDFRADPATRPWHEAAARVGIQASAMLPLHDGRRTTAVLCLYLDQPGFHAAEVRTLLSGLAENVSLALQSFEATSRLQRVARERAEMAHRLIDAQDEERRRIAADVHDDSIQSLAAVDLRLGLLRHRIQQAAPELEPAVVQLQEHLDEVTADLRDLLFDLEVPDLSATLPQLVEEAAAHIFENSDITCSLDIRPGYRRGMQLLGPTVRAQGIRIVKEALVNVRKHSAASHAEVWFRPDAGGVEVVVTDDGVGLPPDTAPRPGHHGLSSMADRAALVGGWLRVEAPVPPAVGARVRFWLPGLQTAPGEMAPTY